MDVPFKWAPNLLQNAVTQPNPYVPLIVVIQGILW